MKYYKGAIYADFSDEFCTEDKKLIEFTDNITDYEKAKVATFLEFYEELSNLLQETSSISTLQHVSEVIDKSKKIKKRLTLKFIDINKKVFSK